MVSCYPLHPGKIVHIQVQKSPNFLAAWGSTKVQPWPSRTSIKKLNCHLSGYDGSSCYGPWLRSVNLTCRLKHRVRRHQDLCGRRLLCIKCVLSIWRGKLCALSGYKSPEVPQGIILVTERAAGVRLGWAFCAGFQEYLMLHSVC